jgi:hypothetical protein
MRQESFPLTTEIQVYLRLSTDLYINSSWWDETSVSSTCVSSANTREEPQPLTFLVVSLILFVAIQYHESSL